MYWHDGWDNAPEIAKLCRRSWEVRNPGYAVHALDYSSLPRVLPDPLVHYEATALNSFANRVRLRLLKAHGGVWADATNFCIRPVDSWIHDRVSPSGFFAFNLPNAERSIATWFLAATKTSPLIVAWDDLLTLYFDHIVQEQRPVHAYFFFPYVFDFMLAENALLRAQWDAVPKLPVGESGRIAALAKLQKVGHSGALDARRCQAISEVLATATMQKLTWKGAMREHSPVAEQVLEILRDNLEKTAPIPAAGR
jgi:hypothetical protein